MSSRLLSRLNGHPRIKLAIQLSLSALVPAAPILYWSRNTKCERAERDREVSTKMRCVFVLLFSPDGGGGDEGREERNGRCIYYWRIRIRHAIACHFFRPNAHRHDKVPFHFVIRHRFIRPPQDTIRTNHRRIVGGKVPAGRRRAVRQAMRMLRLGTDGRIGMSPRKSVPLRRGGRHEERGEGELRALR